MTELSFFNRSASTGNRSANVSLYKSAKPIWRQTPDSEKQQKLDAQILFMHASDVIIYQP